MELKISEIKINFLDSVRAFATIGVFLFHAGYLLRYPENKTLDLVRVVTASGTVAVCMFFVLSGFLLFYQMYKKQEPLTKKALFEYTKKRLLRILPLYYFSLFFIVFIFRRDILVDPDGFRSILFNLLFLRGIKGANGGGTIAINPVYWSLVVEMHFYFLLPIFYYFFYKIKNIWPFIVLIILGFAYRTFLVFYIGNPTMQFMRFTFANFDFFAIGMLGAYFYIHKASFLEKLRSTSAQIVALASFVLFVRFYDLDFRPTVAYIFAPLLLGIIIVVWMLSFVANERTFLGKIFTSAPILFIAKISFSIYVWHAIVINFVGKNIPVSNNLQFLLDVIITLVFSTITYYLVEAPFLKLKRKNSVSVPIAQISDKERFLA